MIRTCQIAAVFCLALWVTGCHKQPSDNPLLDNIKIGQLAPNDQNDRRDAILKTINFDLYVFEMPADNIEALEEIRSTLSVQPFKYSSRLAFSANSFSVYYGRIKLLKTVNDLLKTASAQKATTMSLILNEGQEQTITITAMNFPQVVYFNSSSGLKEGAHIGPGILGLRIKAEKTETANVSCNVTAFPVFALPSGNTIPELNDRVKLREFPFTAAAFGLKMGAGDFIFLAPEKYTGSQPDYLSSLFFNIPGGSLFFAENKRKAPELKPSIRIFLLVCTWIDIE